MLISTLLIFPIEYFPFLSVDVYYLYSMCVWIEYNLVNIFLLGRTILIKCWDSGFCMIDGASSTGVVLSY